MSHPRAEVALQACNTLATPAVAEYAADVSQPADLPELLGFAREHSLAVRVLGEVTAERVALLQEVDDIFIGALRAHDLYDRTAQAFAVLLPVSSVGVMGDFRTYENVVALRAVVTKDFMTADWARLPEDFLAEVSGRIVNRVRGVNRVVYDITSKPPGTIEWE